MSKKKKKVAPLYPIRVVRYGIFFLKLPRSTLSEWFAMDFFFKVAPLYPIRVVRYWCENDDDGELNVFGCRLTY